MLRVWQEQTGNMYIENYKSSILPFSCICVGPREQTKDGKTEKKGPLIGAIMKDFAKDALLVGREKIGVEYPHSIEIFVVPPFLYCVANLLMFLSIFEAYDNGRYMTVCAPVPFLPDTYVAHKERLRSRLYTKSCCISAQSWVLGSRA